VRCAAGCCIKSVKSVFPARAPRGRDAWEPSIDIKSDSYYSCIPGYRSRSTRSTKLFSIGKITFVKPGPLLSVCLSVPGVHSKNLVLMMPKVVSRPEFTQDHESGLRSDRRPPLRTSSSM
jgi:hypothetical protein